MKRFLSPTHKKRILFFLIIDILLVIASLYLAFIFRFDLSFPGHYAKLFKRLLFLFLIVKIPLFWFFKLYHITWKYVGLYDFFNIVKASFLSTTTIGIIIYFLKHPYFDGTPRSVVVIDFFISLFLISFIRISKRFLTEFLHSKKMQEGIPTIIIGAGDTGEMIARDITRNETKYQPIGFLDDDLSLFKSQIHGIPILGPIEDLPDVIIHYNIGAAIIAIPSIKSQRLRKIYKILTDHNVKDIKVIPTFYKAKKDDITIKSLEDIKIEDLLGRQEIHIDTWAIGEFLKDKKIMITGAAGSIGSEIAKQVASYKPQILVLYEIDETRLFELENELSELYPEDKKVFISIIGDIRDKEKIDKVFSKYMPDIVFHAAAYKHVPLMERHPEEAIKTNVMGTYNLAEISTKYNVKKFILISTDKAVNPKSVMGWSKKMAEDIVRAFGKEGSTEFIAVRFGNVLGSRGSVLPIFLRQIKKGGPVTVTDKNMKRYFMTIPEAVALVLEASVIGKNGEILILDMGEPVSIFALAEELIRLHGLTPHRDIEIKTIGPRPGEKLFEELIKDTEDFIKTQHERIFVVKSDRVLDLEEIDRIISEERFFRS